MDSIYRLNLTLRQIESSSEELTTAKTTDKECVCMERNVLLCFRPVIQINQYTQILIFLTRTTYKLSNRTHVGDSLGDFHVLLFVWLLARS
jgi:hypothetical protein